MCQSGYHTSCLISPLVSEGYHHCAPVSDLEKHSSFREQREKVLTC